MLSNPFRQISAMLNKSFHNIHCYVIRNILLQFSKTAFFVFSSLRFTVIAPTYLMLLKGINLGLGEGFNFSLTCCNYIKSLSENLNP